MPTEMAASTSATREELVERAKALAAEFEPRCFEAERLGRVPEANVEALVQSGLIRIGAPARFGGYDVDLDTAYECTIEIARACAATAWCFSLYTSHLWWTGYYSPELQQEVFADGPDVLIASVSMRRWNKVVPVAGGYQVSGHWMMSSGIDHVSWVFVVAEDDAGQRMTMVVPASDIEIVQDSWQVSGLQGTGSKDFVIESAFVPAHRVVGYAASLNGDLPSPFETHPQRRYSVPQGALQLWDLVSPAIGLAYAAVDEMTRRLAGSSGSIKSADSALVQARIAESAMEADLARMLMRTDTREAQDLGMTGVGVTPMDLARYNRNKAYAVKLSVQAVNRMFDMAGGRALFRSDRLQLIHRDAQACLHRDKLFFDLASANYGRALLGLEYDTL